MTALNQALAPFQQLAALLNQNQTVAPLAANLLRSATVPQTATPRDATSDPGAAPTAPGQGLISALATGGGR